MKNLIKIILIIVVCGFVINICRAKFTNMKENETYVSSTNSKIKIELTDEDFYTDDGFFIDTKHVAYLYVDDVVYNGGYTLFVNNIFQKELWVDFYDYYEDDNTTGALYEYFWVKGKRITTKTGYIHNPIFADNPTFVKQTWWNIWGKKVIIAITILFAIWLFKDLFTKEGRKDAKEIVKDSMNEYKEDMKETVRDSLENIKDSFRN